MKNVRGRQIILDYKEVCKYLAVGLSILALLLTSHNLGCIGFLSYTAVGF
jgi:hypothetical protein